MLKLENKTLSPKTTLHLNTIQADIDVLKNFEARVEKADTKWEGKENSIAGKNAFAEIKVALQDFMKNRTVCHYCELSKSYDIEHVAPKGLFPNKTFKWDNYLFVCKNCNTGEKLDKMYVFNPAQSANVEKLTRGIEPPSDDLAFINPRVEDPLQLMVLDLNDFCFYARTKHKQNSRSFIKVEKTNEILNLDSYAKTRKDAFDNYKRALKEYVEVLNANTFDEINEATVGNPQLNTGLPFDDEKQRVLDGIKNQVKESVQPTVWREILRQRKFMKLVEKSKARYW